MKYRRFGQYSGLHASELILGTSMFGAVNGYGADRNDSLAMLKTYADAGGNFIDTSDAYQKGGSEKVVGEFLGTGRNNFIISDKFTRSAVDNPAIALLGNNRKAMVQSVEDSLRRLKTDRIDIYMAHLDDGVTGIEEIVRGLDDLVRAGKIIYGGFSNFPAWKVSAAIGIADLGRQIKPMALQIEYNLVQRSADAEILPMAAHFGMGTMAYSPLAGGLLTGKYRNNETGRISLMKNRPQWVQDTRTEAILDALFTIGKETGYTPGNIALAWMQSKNLFPIIGPRAMHHLEEYVRSLGAFLSGEHVAMLDEISKIQLPYPQGLLRDFQKILFNI